MSALLPDLEPCPVCGKNKFHLEQKEVEPDLLVDLAVCDCCAAEFTLRIYECPIDPMTLAKEQNI